MLSGSLPHLVSGVSRQVDAMRLPTHLKEQVNRFSAPASGNQRRPSFDHIAQLPLTSAEEFFYHSIHRDEIERYHVLISNGDLKVFDINGNEKTVAFPNGKAYLTSSSPRSMFAAATSADYTFIVNKGTTVAFDDAITTEQRGSEALIFCRAANYARTYTIKIDGTVVAQYTTPDGVDNDRAKQRYEQEAVTPVNLAKTLFWGGIVGGETIYGGSYGSFLTTTEPATINGWTTADGDGSLYGDYGGDYGSGDTQESLITTRLIDNLHPDDWEITRYANVLHLVKKDGSPFSIAAESDRDTTTDAIIVIKDEIQLFSDLPNHGPLGFCVKVTGTPTDGYDDYWVKITKPNDDDDNDNITWRECPEPGIVTTFDAATMPHILVREEDGSFTFKEADWATRKVGTTEDDPSFVGATINDVTFNRGRLIVLTEESVVASVPAEYFDFWRTTLTAQLDDDPIDVAGTSDNVSIFKYGVAFNEDLFLWSGLNIHRLSAGDIMTPKNVALPLASPAQVDVNVSPVATTKSILFVGGSNAYTDVSEMVIAGDTEEANVSSITAHVPNYITDTCDNLIASDTVSTVILTGLHPNVYVYQYYWAGQEKLQNAWHKWVLTDSPEVIGGAFFEDELHLLLRRGESFYLEKAVMSATVIDEGHEWQIRLDRRVFSESLTSYVDGDYTVFYMPDDLTVDDSTLAVKLIDGSYGKVADFSLPKVDRVRVKTEDLPVVIGKKFTSRLEFHPFYVREQKGEAMVPMKASPFRLSRLFIHYDKTAYMKAYVTPYVGGTTYSKTLNSLALDEAAYATDEVPLADGAMSVPVKARSDRAIITMENDTHFPDVVTGVEWEGDYKIRGRRT